MDYYLGGGIFLYCSILLRPGDGLNVLCIYWNRNIGISKPNSVHVLNIGVKSGHLYVYIYLYLYPYICLYVNMYLHF